jgi:DNA-binding transcriptional regulator YiaG
LTKEQINSYNKNMETTELKQIIDNLGLSQTDLANLVGVTPRAVNMWLSQEREVAGPVVAYLRLLSSLPRTFQTKELARIREEDPKMYEGMYKFAFQGAAGNGLGVLVLSRGKVFGSDGGVQYDGTYEPNDSRPGHVDVRLHLTVPPGVPLVQGVPPQPVAYNFDLGCSFPARGSAPIALQTPFGPVNVQVEFIRQVPD